MFGSRFDGRSPSARPQGGLFFPGIDAPENEIQAFVDREINPWSGLRSMIMAEVTQSIWYTLGRQWSEIDYQAAFDGYRGVSLTELEQDDIPQPVTNEIDIAIEAEIIALVKRQWIPRITPTSRDPKIKAAAQVSQDILNYRLEQLAWPDKRRQLGMHFAVTGTGLIVSGWDKSYFDMRTIGAPTAVYCNQCQNKFYSQDVPEETLRGGLTIDGRKVPANNMESVKPSESRPSEILYGDDGRMSEAQYLHMQYCPVCNGTQELQPYEADKFSDEEKNEGVDPFGRPLGVQEPRGGSFLDIDMPHEVYIQNGGYKVTPDTLTRFGRRKVRSLEWLEERAPDLVHLFGPDPVQELVYGDPILGTHNVASRWNLAYDTGILDNHKNVDELVELPTFRNPLGRYVMRVKERVIESAPLLEAQVIDGETVYVPRIMLHASRFKIHPLLFWGRGLPVAGISPQNRLNGLDSQLIESRLRMGSPNMSVPEGMWLDDSIQQEEAWGVGKFFRWRPDPANPQAKPEPIAGIGMPPETYMEREIVQKDLKRLLGPSSNDVTQNSKVGTTSGLQLQIEENEKSRGLREDELVRSAERAWSHIQDLEWILRIDPDVYRVIGPDKVESWESYKGSAIRGQTETKVEKGAYLSKSLLRREAAREALADKLIVIDSPIARRKMLEHYDIDVTVNEDTNNQVDHAERQWIEFRDKNRVRVQDAIDDAFIHMTVWVTHLRSEEGERIADEADWDNVYRALAGWQGDLQQMNQLEADSIAFYGGRLVGAEAEEAYASAVLNFQGQQKLYTQQSAIFQQQSASPLTQAAAAESGVPPPAAPLPPQPPPPPIQLPQLLQDRILMIWAKKLKEGNMLPIQNQKQMTYILARALVEAYRLSISGGMAAALPATANPGMAPANAPGAAPAMLGAGAGQGAAGQPGAPASVSPTSPLPEGGAR